MDKITSNNSSPSSSAKSRKDEYDSLGTHRVYKKTSANSALTLYLGSRDLISKRGFVEPLRGVIYIDPKFMCSQKIYGQLTLTFRYGREDEEVMGLKFCNEAVISLKQIWPKVNYNGDDITPLQQALMERLGQGAYPFTLEIGMLAPPSVQLIPAKKYNGAPIGTSYDIRVFMSDLTDEKLQRRTTVKLGIRLMHKIPSDLRAIEQTNPTFKSLPKTIRLRLSPKQLKFHPHKHQSGGNAATVAQIGFSENFVTFEGRNTHPSAIHEDGSPSVTNNQTQTPADDTSKTTQTSTTSNGRGVGSSSISNPSTPSKGPEGCVDKPFLWTEGRVSLKASLNKSAYGHGEKILVKVDIKNNSRKVIRKIRVFAVQHVDVCMFSNGKFKNVVADISEAHQLKPSEAYVHTYEVIPVKGPTKNWIAVEGTYVNTYTTQELSSPSTSLSYKIASSAHRGPMTAEERNVFAIYVSYYVKVKLTLSSMGGEVSLKLPFILGHVDDEHANSPEHKEKAAIGCKSTKHQTTTHKDNIIEEDVHEDHDTISLLNNDTEGIREKEKDDKLIQERNLLHRYKLKRESYSRSCEDIESLCKPDGVNVSSVTALVHRQASESTD